MTPTLPNNCCLLVGQEVFFYYPINSFLTRNQQEAAVCVLKGSSARTSRCFSVCLLKHLHHSTLCLVALQCFPSTSISLPQHYANKCNKAAAISATTHSFHLKFTTILSELRSILLQFSLPFFTC